MDTSIYIGLGLQILPQTVNVWVDAPFSQKMMEKISSQVCIFSGRYSFQASSCVVSATCWSIYL
jgi:hypothetical protein